MSRKKNPFLSLSFRLVATVFCVLLLLSYVSALIDPGIFPPAGFFGLYFIPVLAVNVLLLIIALLRWSSSVWIPVIALLPSFFFLGFFFRAGDRNSLPDRVVAETEGLRLLTWNVGGFRSGDGCAAEESLAGVVELIERESPDVVSLQEFRADDAAELGRMFPGYPYIRRHFYTDIEYGDGVFRLYNVHLESNNISLASLIKEIRGGYDEFSQELAEAHEKVKKSSSRRGGQVRALLENISECGLPAVICGDVNDTPMSYCFRTLYRGRRDTFCEAGKGFGATYRILWPLLRIDYVFVPEESQVLEHRTLRTGWSDHYPVLVKVHM